MSPKFNQNRNDKAPRDRDNKKRDDSRAGYHDDGRAGYHKEGRAPARPERQDWQERRPAPASAGEQAPETQDALLYGKNSVTELLKSGSAVDTVYLVDTMPEAVAGYYTALGKQAGAVVKRVPASKLQKLCGTQDNQGVAAWVAQVEYASLEDLFAAAAEKQEAPFLVLCDGVEDPHNLGAIIRSAYLCGAHGVVVPRRGSAGITGTVMKASAGAAARLPIARVTNLAQAIRTIKEHNVFVYCADLGGAPLAKTDLSGAVALVLGSEGGGPGALTRKLCDAAVTLEMAPGQHGSGVDSYNVSVAAGILFYDVMRRRNK